MLVKVLIANILSKALVPPAHSKCASIPTATDKN